MSYVGNKPAQTTIPADDAVTTAMIQDDAVTVDKVANAINTSIAANTSKVTNATHTGDVTGATSLTIAVDAVDIAMLSATGTASSSTFLRGDNAWAEAGGGKLLQMQSASLASSSSTSSSATYIDTGLSVAITPTAGTSKIVVWATVPAYVIASSRAQICYNLIENASSTTLCEFINRGFSTATNHMPQYLVSGVFSCSDTSELTFKTQMKLGTVAGTSSFYYLGYDTGATLTIIAMEVGA